MRLCAGLRCVLLAAFVALPALTSAQEIVRVTSADAAVYLRPEAASAVILRVPVGTLLDVVRPEGDWYSVVLPPDTQGLRRLGYVAARAVELVGRTPAGQAAAAPEPVVTGPSESGASWAREGAFVGVSVPFHRLQVNQEDILVYLGDYLLVPSFSDQFGFSMSVGHRSASRSIEFSYTRSTHPSSATFVLPGVPPTLVVFEAESIYQRLNVDYKVFLSRRSRVQPFLVFGAGFPWLRIKEGGFVSGSVVDTRFSGVGGDAGGGLHFFAHPRIAVQLGVVYRYDLFLSARGGELDWTYIEDLVSFRGVQVSSGVSFTF
jgi:hypothetical protein